MSGGKYPQILNPGTKQQISSKYDAPAVFFFLG